jgi:Recombination endonuclease VII
MTRSVTPELMTKPCRTCGAIERGKSGRCLPCNRRRFANDWPSATKEARKAYRESHPEVIRGQRRRAYGLTNADFEALRQTQDGKCGICYRDLPLAVDHDHATGVVRGLLCSNCNIGIGNLQDDPRLLLSALNYLDQTVLRRTALKVV